jgi:hypothetical protein
MIRRNLPLGTDPQEWLLISQIEHARLSRMLAEHWGNDEVPPIICKPDESNPAQLKVRREVLAAIVRHDNGWAEWEAAPTLDFEYGRPLDFMEMPQTTAVSIWEKSIHAARREGPLGGWIVAGHFLALLDNSHHPLEDETANWRDRIEKERAAWHEEWLATDARLHTEALANESLRWLQLFDWLSLWHCCNCPVFPSDTLDATEPLELQVSGSHLSSILFKPSSIASGFEVLVEPWPFETPEFTFSASCNVVPAKRYASSQELVAAYEPRQLKWRLRPM